MSATFADLEQPENADRVKYRESAQAGSSIRRTSTVIGKSFSQ
jgi:hypothetical protein